MAHASKTGTHLISCLIVDKNLSTYSTSKLWVDSPLLWYLLSLSAPLGALLGSESLVILLLSPVVLGGRRCLVAVACRRLGPWSLVCGCLGFWSLESAVLVSLELRIGLESSVVVPGMVVSLALRVGLESLVLVPGVVCLESWCVP